MNPETKKRRFEGIKFLYVDDEPDNLESFRLNYENQFEILTSANPTEAIDIIRKESSLAVLVVDQVMPRMTGIQLAIEAKKIRPTLTCIMITGNATKKLAIDAVRGRTFWEFLEKPVNFSAPDIRQLFIGAVQEHLLEKVKTDYQQGTINLLAQLIDDKDGHTHAHSGRVTKWSMKIAKKFDLSEREMVIIREGSLLHDIGKISIPDDILKKPGRLSELERKIIMTHPGRGGDLLEKVPQLKELAPIARYHHERPDGKGYPDGLTAEQIPLTSAIVGLADFFEALSSKRPYKEAWHIDDIVKEVASLRGTQFIEDVVDALFAVLEEEGHIQRKRINEIVNALAA
jgi:response regulator RpfG family c-di-GMP phosphodiesterase